MPPRREQGGLRPGRARLYNLGAGSSSGSLVPPSSSSGAGVPASEAPYLTNLEQHFGRVTLTAPDNMLRKQAKEKKKQRAKRPAPELTEEVAGPSTARRPEMPRNPSSNETRRRRPASNPRLAPPEESRASRDPPRPTSAMSGSLPQEEPTPAPVLTPAPAPTLAPIQRQPTLSLPRSRAQRASLRRHNIWDDIELPGADEDLPPPFPAGATRPPASNEAEWTTEEREHWLRAQSRMVPDSPPPAFMTDPESDAEPTATGQTEEQSEAESEAESEVREERRLWEEDLRAGLDFEERLRREQERREQRERVQSEEGDRGTIPQEAESEQEAAMTQVEEPVQTQEVAAEEQEVETTTPPPEVEEAEDAMPELRPATPQEEEAPLEPRPVSPPAEAEPPQPRPATPHEQAQAEDQQPLTSAVPEAPIVHADTASPTESGSDHFEEIEAVATSAHSATPSPPQEANVVQSQESAAPVETTTPAVVTRPWDTIPRAPLLTQHWSEQAARPYNPEEQTQLEESDTSEEEFWFASGSESEGSSPFEPMSDDEVVIRLPAKQTQKNALSRNGASKRRSTQPRKTVQERLAASFANDGRPPAASRSSAPTSATQRQSMASSSSEVTRSPVLVLRPPVERQLPSVPTSTRPSMVPNSPKPSMVPTPPKPSIGPHVQRPPSPIREQAPIASPAGVFEPLDSDSEGDQKEAPAPAPVRQGPAELTRSASVTRRFPPPRQRTTTATTPSWMAYIPSADKGKLPAPLEPQRLPSASISPSSPPSTSRPSSIPAPDRPSQPPVPPPPRNTGKRVSAIISRFEAPNSSPNPPGPSSRPTSASNLSEAYAAYSRRSVSPSKLGTNILLAPRVNGEAGPSNGDSLLRRRPPPPPPPMAEPRSRPNSTQMPPSTLPASGMLQPSSQGAESAIPRSPRTMAMDSLLGRSAEQGSAPPQVPSKSPIVPPEELFRSTRIGLNQSLAAARAAAMSRRENKLSDTPSSPARRPLPVPQGPPLGQDRRPVAGLFGPGSAVDGGGDGSFPALEGRRPLPTLPDSVLDQHATWSAQPGYRPQLSLRPPALPERPRGRQWEEMAASSTSVARTADRSASPVQRSASDESEDDVEELLSSPIGGTPARTASEEEPTASNLINAAASAVGAAELNRRISMRPRASPATSRYQPPLIGTNLTRSNSIGFTDLDLLVSQLESSGSHYEQLSTLGEFLGPAKPTKATQAELNSLVVGKVECESRRRTKEGKVKQKLSVVGVRVDKCAICLAQFREGAFACVFQCLHVFHEGCARRLLQMVRTCPTCRRDCFAPDDDDEAEAYEFEGPLI